MGTRHLIEVIKDKEIKIAQYGQWDGYPEGQGKTILEFLHKNKLDEFKNKLSNCHFLTQEEMDEYNRKLKNNEITYPYQMSRDRGAEILEIVMNSEDTIDLVNEHNFGFDSLFCEWAYIINFDTNLLEIYTGFNKNPQSPDEKFYLENSKDGYYGITLKKQYNLNDLPDFNTFMADLEENEDE